MKKTKKLKKTKHFAPKIRSRHPSHNIFRSKVEEGKRKSVLGKFPFRSIIRLGSTTQVPGDHIEINTVEAVQNSSNKQTMKQLFDEHEVRTATWWNNLPEYVPFPIVAKHHYGSRGRGNYLIRNREELDEFLNRENNNQFIFERYHTHAREYRIHVTRSNYFYTCRKMIRNNTSQENRWFRNDSNSVWILEENPQFDKPSNWDEIVSEAIKSLNAVELDIGAVDMKVSSRTDEEGNHDYLVIEVNSAPSFGDITVEKYKEEIPKILKEKANV